VRALRTLSQIAVSPRAAGRRQSETTREEWHDAVSVAVAAIERHASSIRAWFRQR
jgi:hypothetical protein